MSPSNDRADGSMREVAGDFANAPLAGLQIAFSSALLDASLEPALIEHLARPSADTSPETQLNSRIALYRGNVHAHRRTALGNAYPVLMSLVGDEYFDALSRAYGLAHPSQSGDLNRFGDQLPSFIAMYETHTRYAYFSDIARLEWAVHQAHYAADVTPFTANEWTSVGDRLLDARIVIHPACNIVASPHAIGDIWLAHEPGGAFPSSIDKASHVLVVRPAWRASVINQSDAAHHAFAALQSGLTLNEALDVAFAIDEAFDFAAQWRVWVEAAAVVGV